MAPPQVGPSLLLAAHPARVRSRSSRRLPLRTPTKSPSRRTRTRKRAASCPIDRPNDCALSQLLSPAGAATAATAGPACLAELPRHAAAAGRTRARARGLPALRGVCQPSPHRRAPTGAGGVPGTRAAAAPTGAVIRWPRGRQRRSGCAAHSFPAPLPCAHIALCTRTPRRNGRHFLGGLRGGPRAGRVQGAAGCGGWVRCRGWIVLAWLPERRVRVSACKLACTPRRQST